ncbi:thioredoxin domain-containing protein 9-like [Drosophila obscura]|uniref:thioredoxin domain-containing protein 9-like n=1 Tax=Drosophila obscura TaxID=7282 RepID=UPI001BB13393|nr:thioredoxin domain-containing protein 9-like [Drosophila obscura]
MADRNASDTIIRLSDERQLIEWTKNQHFTARFVCHIVRPNNQQCRQLEKHLKILAAKHPEAKFCALNADKAPNILARLSEYERNDVPQIVVLHGGWAEDVIFGYAELQNSDGFCTELIEQRIAESGAIECRMQPNQLDRSDPQRWMTPKRRRHDTT